MLLDDRHHLLLGGDAELQAVHLQDVAQAVHRVQVGRVGDRHNQGALAEVNGHALVFVGDVPGQDLERIVLQGEAGDVHRLHAELDGLGLGDVRRVDDLRRQQPVYHALIRELPGLHLRAGLGDILIRHQPHVGHRINQIIVFNWHGLKDDLKGSTATARHTNGG